MSCNLHPSRRYARDRISDITFTLGDLSQAVPEHIGDKNVVVLHLLCMVVQRGLHMVMSERSRARLGH